MLIFFIQHIDDAEFKNHKFTKWFKCVKEFFVFNYFVGKLCFKQHLCVIFVNEMSHVLIIITKIT